MNLSPSTLLSSPSFPLCPKQTLNLLVENIQNAYPSLENVVRTLTSHKPLPCTLRRFHSLLCISILMGQNTVYAYTLYLSTHSYISHEFTRLVNQLLTNHQWRHSLPMSCDHLQHQPLRCLVVVNVAIVRPLSITDRCHPFHWNLSQCSIPHPIQSCPIHSTSNLVYPSQFHF